LKPVSETPTEPAHYAALSLAYGSLLAGLAASARHREPIPARELAPLAAATFALSKLVVREKVETWVREPFVEERPGGDRQPRGEGLRYAVGELLTCTRCMGAWSALGLVGLRVHSPAAGRAVTSVLAASAGNDFLHAGFQWACSKSNRASTRAEAAEARVQRNPDPEPAQL
jgi:hypothetical protein